MEKILISLYHSQSIPATIIYFLEKEKVCYNIEMWFKFQNSKDPKSLHNLHYYSRITIEENETYPKDETGQIVPNMGKVKQGSIVLHWADVESKKKSKTVMEYASWDALQYDYKTLLQHLNIKESK